MINRLICEYPLPLPPSVKEDADGDFKEVTWDEFEFYTPSFLISNDFMSQATYTITSDGQLYKDEVDFEVAIDEDGEIFSKETNSGIEKQDFTGQVLFGSEVLGDDNDHSIDFKALFYKGELKELDLEDYTKHSNERRKAAATEISDYYVKEVSRKKSLTYLITLPFRWIILFLVKIIKWIMFKIFILVVKAETWSRK